MGKMHKKRTSKERGVADIVRSRIVAGGERVGDLVISKDCPLQQWLKPYLV